MNERHGYGFTNEAKAFVRDRSQGKCEFPGTECSTPNNNIVHHLTGAFEARLDNKSKTAMTDATTNAIMLCDSHTLQHDAQEQFQVECLLGERQAYRGIRNTRYHRRRRR